MADRWANDAGWTVLGVVGKSGSILVDATGPSPEPSVTTLGDDLRTAGLGGVSVRVQLLTGRYVPVS